MIVYDLTSKSSERDPHSAEFDPQSPAARRDSGAPAMPPARLASAAAADAGRPGDRRDHGRGRARAVLLPGDRIVEAELARKLGVSRVPVREALRLLESQGVVVNEPYKGIRLRPVTNRAGRRSDRGADRARDQRGESRSRGRTQRRAPGSSRCARLIARNGPDGARAAMPMDLPPPIPAFIARSAGSAATASSSTCGRRWRASRRSFSASRRSDKPMAGDRRRAPRPACACSRSGDAGRGDRRRRCDQHITGIMQPTRVDYEAILARRRASATPSRQPPAMNERADDCPMHVATTRRRCRPSASRRIEAAPLFGESPKGGWSAEIRPEDSIHALIAVHTDAGITGYGSVFTDGRLVAGRPEGAGAALLRRERARARARHARSCTRTRSGWAAAAR